MQSAVRPILLVLLTAWLAGTGASRAAGAQRVVTVYTSSSGVQFINTADDRARGATNNPFDASTNKLQPKVNDVGNGPFPGDVVVFAFDLHPGATAAKTVGTASYTCFFNYARHALCQAYYELPGGSVTAAGLVDFKAKGFTLIVTGGTGKYLAARGQATSAQAAASRQRVDLELLS